MGTTKSGAVTSPDVAPQDELSLGDIMGDMRPIESAAASQAVGYWPAEGDPGAKASVQTPGGRISVISVDHELLALDVEDLDGEINLAVEMLAKGGGWQEQPSDNEAFLFDAKVRKQAVYGQARYQRLVSPEEPGGDDASAIGTYFLKVGRMTWSDNSTCVVVLDYRVVGQDYTLVRFAYPEVRSPSAIEASVAELKRLVRHRALAQEGITSSTGFLLVEIGTDLHSDRPIGESWRAIDLHEGRRACRTVAKFQQAEVEADVRMPPQAAVLSESEVRKPE